MTQSGSGNRRTVSLPDDTAQAVVDHGAYHRPEQTVEEPKNRSKRCSGCNDQQGDRREDQGGHGETPAIQSGAKGESVKEAIGLPIES